MHRPCVQRTRIRDDFLSASCLVVGGASIVVHVPLPHNNEPTLSLDEVTDRWQAHDRGRRDKKREEKDTLGLAVA